MAGPEPPKRPTIDHVTFVTVRWVGLSGLAVFATAFGSVALTRNAQHLSTFWPANAVLLAMLLRTSPRNWPQCLVGALVGQAAAQLMAGDPRLFAIGISALSSLEVLCIAFTLRRWLGRDLDLSLLRHLGIFVLIAGVVAPAASTTVAVGIIASVRHITPAAIWPVWFPVNALGFLVFAPPLLMRRSAFHETFLCSGKRLEAAAWFAALVVVTVATFAQSTYPLLFMPLPVLALIAVRLGSTGTLLSVGFVAVVAALATLDGRGPIMLVSTDPTVRSFVLQGFVATVVLGNLPLTALLSELGRSDAKARETNRRLRFAEEIAQIGHWRFDPITTELTWSEGVYRIHGLDPATYVPSVEEAITAYHPDDRAEITRLVEQATITGIGYETTLRVIRSDGVVREVLAKGLCEVGADGRVTALFGTIMDVTDLRRAERAAVESEARYRLLAHNTTDMITHMDLTGRRLFVSPGSCDLLGYEPADLVDTSPHEMIHPDDAGGLRAIFSDFAAGRIDRKINVNRLRHRDGRWIWIEASLKLIRGGDGAPSGVIGAMRDITDRKTAEEALGRSQERYRLLADNSTDLIALKLSYAGPRPYVSPSVFAMTGYTPDEFSILAISDYIHPEDQARVEAEYAGLTTDYRDVKSVYRVRHKNGCWLWVETDFRVINSAESGLTVLLRSRDVTARHEAELALAASEARYRALAETTSDVITQLNLELRLQYVSPSCRRVLGYEPEEMLNISFFALMHAGDIVAAEAAAARVAAGAIAGDQTIATFRVMHRAGHWVWAEASMTLMRDPETDAPKSLICSLRDVTERQYAAQQLEHAKIAADNASKQKAEFVANMSHELRTPLTGILGLHDLLQADPTLGPKQRRYLIMARDTGRSLLAIVNDVLDFSKIEAGELTIESMPFNLLALLESCEDLMAEAARAKSLRLDVCVVDAKLTLLGDAARLKQILLNFLTNAVKFTDQGAVTLKANYSVETGLLRFDVTDTGIGVAEEKLPLMFKRFSQVDASITRRYGGTGLGLAICQRLTELMGGQVGVSSVPGQGSTFWAEIPTKEVSSASSHPDNSGFGHIVPRRILLAEDNLLNQEIIKAMLEKRGHEVTVVDNGAAAVATACSSPAFDVVLMDVQMPIMDGLLAARAIRMKEGARGCEATPIIGLTANAMVEDVARCMEVGMDAHVAKPIEWAELYETVDCLTRHGLKPDVRLEAAEAS